MGKSSFPPHPNEPDLRRRYRLGDRAAFDELWRYYEPCFRSQALKQAFRKRDLADEAMGIFSVKLSYPWAQASFDPDFSWKNWASRILRNTVIDLLRKGRRAPLQEPEDGLDGLPAKPSALDSEFWPAFEDCVGRLPEAQRSGFILRFGDKQPYRVIAETLGATLGTVASRINRAREAMKDCLSHKGYGAQP